MIELFFSWGREGLLSTLSKAEFIWIIWLNYRTSTDALELMICCRRQEHCKGMENAGSRISTQCINKAEEMQVCCGNKKKQNKVCWNPSRWDNQQSCFENLIIVLQNILAKSSLSFFLYFKFYQFGKSRLHLPLHFMLIHIPEAQEGFEIMKPNAALDF